MNENKKPSIETAVALVNTADKALKNAMAQVTISEKVTDVKLAEALKRSAVYTATGAKSQSLLWIALADAKAINTWKEIKDIDGANYKNFAKFALDFVPGLARETKESSIRSYLAAGEVIRAVPELSDKPLSADALNTLHVFLSSPEGVKTLKESAASGEFDSMTNQGARDFAKKYAPATGKTKNQKPERLFKVNTDSGEVKLLSKQELLALVAKKKEVATANKSGKEYCHIFSAGGFYCFEVDGKGGSKMAFSPQETEEEAAKRSGDILRYQQAEARKESRMNQLGMELDSLFKSLVEAGIPKEMAEGAALNQLCVLHPAEAEDFKKWLDRAPMDTEDFDSSSKN